jgi:hypothetical protein
MSQDDTEEATIPTPSGDMMPEGLETYLLSEAALAKDWLSPGEDEAWEHLQEQETGTEEGSAYDLFKGLIGHFRSGGDGLWSQNCGEKFAEGMAEKRRQGHL